MKNENKSRSNTIDKLVNAVGEVIKNDGYTKLGVNNVARTAGVDKKLIYVYFGSLENLVNTYLTKYDSWINFANFTRDALSKTKFTTQENVLNFYLEKQFTTLKESKLYPRLIEWSMNDSAHCLKEFENERHKKISEIFELSRDHFENTNVNYRAIFAILVSAINYISLRSNTNDKMLCDLNLDDDYDRAELINAIKMINSWSFETAGKSNIP